MNTTEKYIVQSKGIGGEEEQIIVDVEKLRVVITKSKISLIECYYQIKGTGTLTISATSEEKDLTFDWSW